MKRVRQDGRNAQNPCLERPEDVLDGSSSSTPLWPWQNTILEVRLSRVREHLRGDEPPRPSGGWEREETLYVICPFLFQIDRISSMSTKYLCEHAPRQTSGEARTFPNPPAAPKNRAFEGGSGKTVTEENPSTFLVLFRSFHAVSFPFIHEILAQMRRGRPREIYGIPPGSFGST